ncbi:MAG: glutathione S-transferase N-terminal domain-containing protein [Alphaproteobacteria bacterium]
MKLYVTPTSPYARLALIVRLEKGLADRVELVWTRTRNPNDPMLAINPSGRIPFLFLEDGTGYEDTDVIVPYLDNLVSPSKFELPGGEAYWPFRRLQAMARSMLEGVSVWAREILRPKNEQSPGIIEHERRRASRMADYFESIIREPPLTGNLNTVQLTLFCALDVERRLPALNWRTGRPRLVNWYTRMLDVPSVSQSEPPPSV